MLCLLWASVSHARSQNEGSAFLVDVGERSLEKGNITNAIHEFSKALMLDPYNERALKHLQAYGLNEGLYANVSKTRTEQVFELQEKVANLQNEKINMQAKIAQLQTEKVPVVETSMIKEHSMRAETEKLDMVEQSFVNVFQDKVDRQDQFESEAYEQHAWQNQLIHVLEDYLSLRERRLHDAKDALVYKEMELVKHQQILLNRLEELQYLHNSVYQMKDKVGNIHELISVKNKQLGEAQETIERLREEKQNLLKVIQQERDNLSAIE